MTTLGAQEFEVLLFVVGGQRYALRSTVVQEIVRAVTIVPLPRAPAIIEGIIDVRGTIVPVLDIRQRFRLPAKPITPSDHLILARSGQRLLAIRADHAIDLVRIGPHEIDGDLVLINTAYVAGVARLEGGLVLIHDLGSFLSQAEALTLETALDADRGGPTA